MMNIQLPWTNKFNSWKGVHGSKIQSDSGEILMPFFIARRPYMRQPIWMRHRCWSCPIKKRTIYKILCSLCNLCWGIALWGKWNRDTGTSSQIGGAKTVRGYPGIRANTIAGQSAIWAFRCRACRARDASTRHLRVKLPCKGRTENHNQSCISHDDFWAEKVQICQVAWQRP